MKKYIIGIDEVGRGPIAGPVAVGVFVFLDDKTRKIFSGVKESKQLSEEKREKWYGVIMEMKKQGRVDFSVTFQSEKVIDKNGISFAIKKCIETSLNKLHIDSADCRVLLDGGLKAPVEYKNQKTIIKGDEKEMVIALASICAKVLRDRKMVQWGRQFPEYGFEVHKGYGTKGHREAIKREGLVDLHRRSFLRDFLRNS